MWWNQKIPAYLYNRPNIITLILSTAIFALVFINIYTPFNSRDWYPAISDFKFFVFSSLIILTGVLVVAIIRIILYYYGKKHSITMGRYAICIVCEVFFMSLFYTTYSLVLKPNRDYLEVFKESTVNTALVLLLPYTLIHLYLIYKENKQQLRDIENQKNQPVETTNLQKTFLFYDEKNELRLSVNRNNLLYIESADNYVQIWYLNKGSLARFMLRNSMKTMEEQLADTNVLRCHRSYMVNFEQINVIRRQKDGMYVEFGIKDVPDIPISKKYSEKVIQYFTNYL
ncbi:MAG: LytTR family transcriptional regulator [Dysgonamonadaceae bacterium]|nr:LytTR family transcriptional regulator [Dysgonamonadaceae bacterium]